MKSLKTALIAALALTTLAGCGTAAAPLAANGRQDAAVEAQGKGKLILKLHQVGIGPGLPGERPEIVGAGFEVDKLGFNQRPGSAHTTIKVDGKDVAEGSVYLAADGKVYLGEYNGGKESEYVQLGTYTDRDPGRLPFGHKLNVKWSVDLDWFYKHEGGIMGHTTFYLIMKQAPKKVKTKLNFIKAVPTPQTK